MCVCFYPHAFNMEKNDNVQAPPTSTGESPAAQVVASPSVGAASPPVAVQPRTESMGDEVGSFLGARYEHISISPEVSFISLGLVYQQRLNVVSMLFAIFKWNITRSNRPSSTKFTPSSVDMRANINLSTKKYRSPTAHSSFVIFSRLAFEYHQRSLRTDGRRSEMRFR